MLCGTLFFQVVPLFILSAIFTVQLYFKPYQHWLPNLIEAAVLLNYISFFIMRYSHFLMNLLANNSYSGTMVPSNSTHWQGLPHPDGITFFFSLGFYAPFVVGAIGCVVWLMWFIK